MNVQVEYKREIAYQFMRTIRAMFGPPMMVAFVIGVVTFAKLCLNLIDQHKKIASRMYGEGYMLVFSSIEDIKNFTELDKVTIYNGVLLLVMGVIVCVSFAAFTPYLYKPMMPSFKIRKCGHCNGVMKNAVFYRCPICDGKFPAGVALWAIRFYGVMLTVSTILIYGSIFILCRF